MYSNSRRPVSPVLARGSKKLFRTFLPINWTNRGNEGLSGGRDAVLPPDRLNSPGWDKCEFISRDAFKQGSKARCVFQRELLSNVLNNFLEPLASIGETGRRELLMKNQAGEKFYEFYYWC
jgi:hypothetical protein